MGTFTRTSWGYTWQENGRYGYPGNSFERAIHRACDEVTYVTCVVPWLEYTVPSSSGGDDYTVRGEVDADGWYILRCSCPAGVNFRDCKHAAAVWMTQNSERLDDRAYNRHFPPSGDIPDHYFEPRSYSIPSAYRYWR